MLAEGDSDWDHQSNRALSLVQYTLDHLGTQPDLEWLVERHTVAFQTLVLVWEFGPAEQGTGWSVEEVELKLQGVEHWDNNVLEFDREVGQKPQWIGPQDMADMEQQGEECSLVDILHAQRVVVEQGKYSESQGREGEVPVELMVVVCLYVAEWLLLWRQWGPSDKVSVQQLLLKL